MGEVWRATDTKLNREVAIKVLPPALADDPDYLTRFAREAQVLASLNHPNIAIIHGVEDRALVMEFVPGPTLEEIIASGPVPIKEALDIARQIAEALEAAHEKGVTHRDLKPANVKVTPEGVVKVLDFGLAKAADPAPSNPSTNSPTLTLRATQAGLIMGTAGYMAPEQAAAKPVDRRADIWSFGVVLWEILTGQRLFTGETTAHILAGVIRADIDFTKLPPATPEPIRALLCRCLDRNVKNRLQWIGEARFMIDQCGAGSIEAAPPIRPHPAAGSKLAWAIAALALLSAAAAVSAWRRDRAGTPDPQVLRYTLDLPERTGLSGFAISPDGRYVAIVGTGERGQLWVRALNSLRAQPLSGTERAAFPFWSADSRFIAFFASDKLKKIAVTGGPAQTVCGAPNSRGGAWSRDGVIVFAPMNGNLLQRVSATGGVPVEIRKAEQGNFRFPAFLTDGRRFLYTDRGGKEPGVYVASLDSKEVRRLALDQSNAMYAPPSGSSRTGYVLFVREHTLMAQPVDAAGMEPAGDVFQVAERVTPQGTATLNQYSLSANGLLIYQTGGTALGAQLAWFDRAGKLIGNVGAPGLSRDFALSPDGKRVLIERVQDQGSDLWMLDLEHNDVESRFTFDLSGVNRSPVWSPDGSRVAFTSSRAGTAGVFEKPSNQVGEERQLFPSETASAPYDWSRDGKFLIFASARPKIDLLAFPIGGGEPANPGERKPIPLIKSTASGWMGQLSPDERWLAYVSDETGRSEVYVQPFAPGSQRAVLGKWPISAGGGGEPRWSADGKELFLLSGDGNLMAAQVKTAGTTFERSTPQTLFAAHISDFGSLTGRGTTYHYVPSADGKRFLISTNPEASGGEAPQINVVVNWLAGLRK